VPLLLYLLNSVCPSRASQHTPSTERRWSKLQGMAVVCPLRAQLSEAWSLV
jgi:hypothetical protein